ncbi:MAG: nickel/cobalt transporter [Candidatus Limnocylindrales bacterium]
MRRVTFAMLIAAALALSLPALASAHPLGNFTINHYAGIRVEPERVVLDVVIDEAEIPTFQERIRIDRDGDGTVSASETETERLAACPTLAASLDLTVGGARLPLTTAEAGLSFPAGAAGLQTMRLVCVYSAVLSAPLGSGTPIGFQDTSHAERIGWREVVVTGSGVTLAALGLAMATVSDRLRAYPQDLLSQPLDVRVATFTASTGGPTLPPLSVPDAVPVSGAAPLYAATPAGDPSSPAGNAATGAGAVPNGVTELPAELAAALQAHDLTPPLMALALLIALGLGALHAVTPGHGKTIMAAYLVGTRGNVPQALGLGATVAVSHTLGVLALGLLTVAASSVFPTERLFPILTIISGTLVLGIGGWLLLSLALQLRGRRAVERDHARAHAAAHEAGVDHDHDHEHEHGDDPDADAQVAGWHSHGGIRHSHLPSPNVGATLRWRGIFALGLAGGLVPSASAILLLLGAVSVGRPAFGLVLIVAFGVGLALVLVGIGFVLVHARGRLERLPRLARDGRFAFGVSLMAACVVLAFGLVITTQALATLRL